MTDAGEMQDAREELRESIRLGIRDGVPGLDPDQISDCADAAVDALTKAAEDSWLVLGRLGHVYRVQQSRMTDASPQDYSRWDVHTRNDR